VEAPPARGAWIVRLARSWRFAASPDPLGAGHSARCRRATPCA